MKSISLKTAIAFKLALLNLFLGVLGLIFSFASTSTTTEITQVSIGLILLGTGEYMNNPQDPRVSEEAEKQFDLARYFSRRRSVCALGNLFDIAGIVMITIGVASLFL